MFLIIYRIYETERLECTLYVIYLILMIENTGNGETQNVFIGYTTCTYTVVIGALTQ